MGRIGSRCGAAGINWQTGDQGWQMEQEGELRRDASLQSQHHHHPRHHRQRLLSASRSKLHKTSSRACREPPDPADRHAVMPSLPFLVQSDGGAQSRPNHDAALWPFSSRASITQSQIIHFRCTFILKHGTSVLVYHIFSSLTLEQSGQVLLDELDHSVRSS